MNNAGWLVLAILTAYGCAAVAPFARTWIGGWVGAVIGWCLVPVVLGCPVLIPGGEVGLRAAAAFASVDVAFKLVEYYRHWGQGEGRIGLREYYRFLMPLPVLSVVYPDHKRRLGHPESAWPQVLRVGGGMVGFMLALLAMRACSGSALLRSSFALNHGLMLVMFVVGMESLSRALCGLEHLAGFDTRPPIQNAYLSRTVGEFWRRYNYRMHDWLYQNVFQAAGGRRAPMRSVLLVFLVSGLFHEVMFALATSRLTGYQLAFFALQGPAALASGRLARRGMAGRIAAQGGTILFVGVTSILFFDGVSRIFPFVYAGGSPLP